MRGVASQPKGENGRMLDKPDFIRRLGRARVREGAHGVEALGVGLEAAPAEYDQGGQGTRDGTIC
jgi:hypothetical protein